MPHLIRGPRSRRPSPPTLALACSKICPEWQWGAIRALIKPQYQNAIKHRSPDQLWSREAQRAVADGVAVIHAKLGNVFAAHFPPAGDFHCLIEIPASELEAGKALAVVVSRRLPELWFTLGKWYIRNGRFFRKHRGYNILLKPASNVHLNRSTWLAIQGAVG